MPPRLAEEILALPEYRGKFRKWIIEQMGIRYPRFKLLTFQETLSLRGKGLTRSGIEMLATSSRYVC